MRSSKALSRPDRAKLEATVKGVRFSGTPAGNRRGWNHENQPRLFPCQQHDRDKWNMYWPSFKAFLAAGMADDDLYYEALVELVDATVTTSKVSGE